MKKLYNLAVKVSSYTDRNGIERGRWANMGALMEGDDGGKFIFLDRTFNPAGVPNPENRHNIIVSLFTPKDKDE